MTRAVLGLTDECLSPTELPTFSHLLIVNKLLPHPPGERRDREGGREGGREGREGEREGGREEERVEKED